MITTNRSDGRANAITVGPEVALIARQRIPLTVDPLGLQDANLVADLQPFRVRAITRVFTGLGQIKDNLGLLTTALSQQVIPATLVGALHEPDGTPAGTVQVQFAAAAVGGTGQPVTVVTKADGSFVLDLPAGLPLPDSGLPLTEDTGRCADVHQESGADVGVPGHARHIGGVERPGEQRGSAERFIGYRRFRFRR
jgi:hypothetical protein